MAGGFARVAVVTHGDMHGVVTGNHQVQELVVTLGDLVFVIGDVGVRASMGPHHENRIDNEDFYICSISDTKKLVSYAALFLNTVTAFLETQYNKKWPGI